MIATMGKTLLVEDELYDVLDIGVGTSNPTQWCKEQVALPLFCKEVRAPIKHYIHKTLFFSFWEIIVQIQNDNLL